MSLEDMDAARVLDISPETVRGLSNAGKPRALRTMSGRRLFRRSEVDRLAEERSRQGNTSKVALAGRKRSMLSGMPRLPKKGRHGNDVRDEGTRGP
ncbi:helix-turn-helix domain-containing protein [Archangium sp.]|uniref:helix-turn-helix domain-containing protein n=1 Tax=Archangium sp. TaxID=1872627 RepID=UPI0039C88A38